MPYTLNACVDDDCSLVLSGDKGFTCQLEKPLAGTLGHFGQTTTPLTFGVFAVLLGYMYYRLRKTGGTLLPSRR